MIDVKLLLEVVSIMLVCCAIAFTGFRWMYGQLNNVLTKLKYELSDDHQKLTERHESLRSDVDELKSTMPFAYVLRDYYVEQQSLINAKLDSLSSKIDRAIAGRTIVCRGANKKVSEVENE